MKKLLLISLLLQFCLRLHAQDNTPGYDRQKYHFGFSMGYNASSLVILKNQNFYQPDSLLAISPIAGPGFNLGLVADVLLYKHVNLRFTPNLSFVDRSLQYTFQDERKNTIRSIESTYVEFPLDIKIKANRRRNMGFYVIGGLKYSYDVISNKKVTKGEDPFDEATRKVKLQSSGLSYEWGFGWDLYYQYFRFSPEIKFQHGISDLLKKEDHIYSRPLDKLFSRVICITLYFE